MKVSKRLLIGISTVVGALTLGGVALYSMPRTNPEETSTAENKKPADPSTDEPLDDPAPSDDGGPTQTLASLGAAVQVPSPDATVRGNDRAFDPQVPAFGDARELSTAAATGAISDAPEAPPVSPSASPYVTPSTYGDPQSQESAPQTVTTASDSSSSAYAWPESSSYLDSSDPAALGANTGAAAETAADQAVEYPPVRTSVGDTGGYGGRYANDARPTGEFEPPAAPPMRAQSLTNVVEPAPYKQVPQPTPEPYETPTQPERYADRSAFAAELQPYQAAGRAVQPVASAELARPKPGMAQLEGVQTPSVAVEKSGPAEIQIDIPAAFAVTVRNVGTSKAHGVTLTDVVPQGTELIGTQPEAIQGGDGSLVWQLGEMEPGETRTVTLEVMPKVEGDIGSVAQVSFQTQASVRSFCTRPMLKLEHTAPAKVLIGEDAVFTITVSNPGTGAATDVVLEGDVPDQLSHPAGSALESALGTLQPGETREIELVVQAATAGLAEGQIRVRGNGKLLETNPATIEVIAPRLAVNIEGPRQRYVEREVTYDIDFHNDGTAPAKNVDLVAFLPKGLEFLETENKGRYDAQQHAVLWSLVELPAKGRGSVQLRAVPLETGAQVLKVEAQADLGLVSQLDFTTNVDALTELEFSVADTQDPIEVNSETTYEVRVVNNGAKVARDVQLMAILPSAVRVTGADGSSETQIQGQDVLMAPIAELAPRAEASYRIKVVGLQPGDHVIEVRLVSSEVQAEVMKQESTKVYLDR